MQQRAARTQVGPHPFLQAGDDDHVERAADERRWCGDDHRFGAALRGERVFGQLAREHFVDESHGRPVGLALGVALRRGEQRDGGVECPVRLANEWGAQARGTGVLADEANRALDAAVALFAAAQRHAEREPDASAVRFVDEVLASELPEDSLAPQRSAESVVVTTPPALIGRSFDVVVIAGLQDGVWPNLRPRGTLLHAGLLARAAAAVRAGSASPSPEGVAEARASVRGDELRLFALAASRAERQLVLSCTANDDEQPSMLMGYAPERIRAARRRPLHLRGLVAALRHEAVASPAGEAPAALALLAEAGVPGADPADWYGLADPSTVAPLVDLDGDPEALVAISPSQIDRAEESPLGWFIDHVASPPSGVAASIGTLVHAVVEEVGTREDGDTSIDTIWSGVERRWRELRFEAGWVAERERRGARAMAEGAADYLANFADDGKLLLGAEGRFTLVIGRVRISGTIDRVEASADGTTVIVDLKTGRTPPTGEQTAAHPQLAAYQLAARVGEIPNAGVLGGAKLVYLAKPARGVEPEPGGDIECAERGASCGGAGRTDHADTAGTRCTRYCQPANRER